MRLVTVLLLLALAPHPFASAAPIVRPASTSPQFVQVDPVSRQFVDGSGRSLLFHGSSVVYKEAPFVPDMSAFDPLNSLCEQDAQVLQDLGFNFMRVYVAWQGVMPSPGVINASYLDQVEQLVALLAAHNISSILDCHQDVLAPAFCGEGVPEFISDAMYHNSSRHPQSFPIPVSPTHHSYPLDPATGHPNRTECLQAPFWHYYFSDAVSKGFQSLYDNDGGVLDAFEQFWITVATRFKDNPAVIGYELLNEPWVGDFFAHPQQLLARNADVRNLVPMYKRLHNAIRLVDDNHIIFFEPTVLVSQLPFSFTDRSGLRPTANNSIQPSHWHTGFDEGPGGPIYNDRQAMSLHTYCFAQTADGQPKSKTLCHYTDDSYMHVKVQDLQRINVAGFMTEWAKGSAEYIEASTITGLADRFLLSWSYWMFKPFHDITTQAVDADGNVLEGLYDKNGVLQTDKVFVLTRTYARAVAGTFVKQEFDLDTAAFAVTYKVAAAGAGGLQSEVYVNSEYHYPHGYSVAFTPSNCCSWAMASKVLMIISVAPDSEVTVRITAKSQ